MSDFTPTPLVAPAKPRFRLPAIVAGLAFLAGLLAMAAALQYRNQWFPPQAATPATAAKLPIVVLPAGGAAAGAATAATTGAGAPAAAPVIDLNALAKRESDLAGRLADLEQRSARIGGDAQAAAGYATRGEGMMVAFAARRALDRGLQLGYVEDQLRTRFGATQPHAVAAILQAAREPVTIAELRAGLDGIAPELVTGQASNGWFKSFARELANLVVIHRADTPSPLPVDRLARAKQMLDSGKVEAALAEVARMPGARQAARWTAGARRYIGARQALDTIEAAAITGQTNPTDIPGVDAPA